MLLLLSSTIPHLIVQIPCDQPRYSQDGNTPAPHISFALLHLVSRLCMGDGINSLPSQEHCVDVAKQSQRAYGATMVQT